MATVYLARDERHNRSVALKVLKPELASVVGAERFLAEIETTANLQHPHILPLFDSGEAASLVIEPPDHIARGFWGPNSEWLFLRTTGGQARPGRADILAVGPNSPEPIGLVDDAGFDEAHPALSPDGRWLAYMSNEAGPQQIYLRPFPNVDSARTQVSSQGGFLPVWSSDGAELYYLRPGGTSGPPQMIAAHVSTSSESPLLGEEVLFTIPDEGFVTAFLSDFYDVTPDGERFLMVRSVESTQYGEPRAWPTSYTLTG